MERRTSPTLEGLLVQYVLQGEELRRELQGATTPKERKEIHGRQEYNSFITSLLAGLISGEIPTAA